MGELKECGWKKADEKKEAEVGETAIKCWQIVVAKYQQQACSCNSCDEKAWLHYQDYDIIIHIID